MALTISAARAAALILVVFGSAGCHTRSGEAIVLGKEYIPVAEVTASPVPEESLAAQSDDEVEPGPDLANDAPDLRGTAKDARSRARAVDVHVQMVADLRRVDVRVEQPRWQSLQEGDRVKVIDHVGKYTGTIWSSELE